MKKVCLALACVALLPQVSFGQQSGGVDVLKASHSRTITARSTGTSTEVEQGTYWLASDGRRRVERFNKVSGEHTAELFSPKDLRQTAMNVDTKEAVVGPVGGGMAIEPPSLKRGARHTGVPSGLREVSRDRSDLGTKTVGALVLRGSRVTLVFAGGGTERVHHIEMWEYRPADPRVLPVVLEMRFETPEEIDERRITAVTQTRVAASIFAVPSDFTVR